MNSIECLVGSIDPSSNLSFEEQSKDMLFNLIKSDRGELRFKLIQGFSCWAGYSAKFIL